MRPMAIVTAPGTIEIREVPLPRTGPTEVRVDVKAVTLCGSDLHVFNGKHPSVQLPVPVGHEIAGVVSEVGPDVTRIAVGDCVVVEPVLVCDTCHYCTRGHYHLCTNISFQYRRGQGGLTTAFVADQRWVHRLPGGLSFEEGAMLEPLAVVVHAVRKAQIPLGSTVAVFGDGAIGLLITQVARASGAGEITLIGVRESRLRAGRQLGAAHVVDNLKEDAVARIRAVTGGLGASTSFEAVGIAQTLGQAIETAEKGGTVVMVGLFEGQDIPIPANQIVQRELTVHGAQGYAWDFQRAIALVQQGEIHLKEMVSHKFHLQQVQEAFDLLMEPQTTAIKVAVMMGA